MRAVVSDSILKLKQAMESASKGETLQIYATDQGFVADAKAWCESTGNNFVSHHSEKGIHVIQIKKERKQKIKVTQTHPAKGNHSYYSAMISTKLSLHSCLQTVPRPQVRKYPYFLHSGGLTQSRNRINRRRRKIYLEKCSA